MELVARHEHPPRARGRRLTGVTGDGGELDVVSEVLATVRRAKTEAKQSQRASVARLAVTVPAAPPWRRWPQPGPTSSTP